MIVRKDQRPILIVFSCILMLFMIHFITRQNYEFLIYVGVIIFFLIIILLTNRKVFYPNSVLWGMTIWATLHMAGGAIHIGEKVLYELMLIPIVGEPYLILKYDQFVHIIGFGVATIMMYYLLKPLLKNDLNKWISLSIIIVMAGLGVGALNEIIEFMATVLIPQTGVGGYINTSLDLVADLLGSLGALVYLWIKEK